MDEQSQFEERVIQVNRTSKKTSGGNTIGFSTLVVVGDLNGTVGVGLGKARDVLSGIKKGISKAKKNMVTAPLIDGRTIPHDITLKYGAARIMLKPAPRGSGIIAGGAVRTVLELAGYKDVVGKMMGSRNKITNVYATMKALEKLRTK